MIEYTRTDEEESYLKLFLRDVVALLLCAAIGLTFALMFIGAVDEEARQAVSHYEVTE